ncbi:MAG: sugar phosphate isomerase/epimerase [Anaerolineales bacterium]|nr:sugar phosphate isomerase/epimerase [Anaerolineales bacterium]
MKLSIVLSTQPAQFQAATFKGDLERNLEQIASLGYDGVELAIRDPKLVEVSPLQRLLQQCRLEVPAIGTGQAWGEEGLSFTDSDPQIRRAAVERIQSHIPLASRLGAVIIIGLIRGTVQPGVTASQAMDWLVEALQTCCEAALPCGVRYALEPINRYETRLINSAAEGMALIERVGAPDLGLLLDTFHMNIEEPHIEDSIRCCKGHIFHFHVADSNRWHPGAGHLDFGSICSTLAAQAYPGWISGEFLPKPDAVTAAKRCFAHLHPLLT